MRITVTRTGGLAGVRERLGPAETSTLDPEAADLVSRIVIELDFFNLPKDLHGTPIPDGFHYAVQVADSGREHTVKIKGKSNDPVVIRLFELIRSLDQAVGFEKVEGVDDAPSSSTLP